MTSVLGLASRDPNGQDTDQDGATMTGVMKIREYHPDADIDPDRTERCAAALVAAGVPERHVHRLGDGQCGVNTYRAEYVLTVQVDRDGDWSYRGAWGPIARGNDIVCASAAEAVGHARHHGYLPPEEDADAASESTP